jgi:hypothetical protein
MRAQLTILAAMLAMAGPAARPSPALHGCPIRRVTYQERLAWPA